MKILVPHPVNNAILGTSNVTEDDYSAWSDVVTYAKGDRVIWVDPSATVTITIASPGVVTWADHGLANGQVVTFSDSLLLDSGLGRLLLDNGSLFLLGTLPTGISGGLAYYVVNRTDNTFQVSVVKGGAPIVTMGVQFGSHTATASVHLVMESLADSNINNTPPNPGFTSTRWVKVSTTNRWKMFDDVVSARTSNPNTIDVTLKVIGRISAVAFLNLSAESVQVIMTDDVEGEVYNETKNLVSSQGINTWYNYFFTERTRDRDFMFSDLPAFLNTTVRIIITDDEAMAEVGAVVLGKITDFGFTQYGMGIGIIDFSAKNTDVFGNTSVIRRGFKKTLSLDSIIENSVLDQLVNTLTDLRATPVVYEGSDSFGSSLVYGFFKDFDVVVPRPTSSVVTIEIEGLS